MRTLFFSSFLGRLAAICALVVGVGLLSSRPGVEAADVVPTDSCCRCHGAVCADSAGKRYVHAPVLENMCAVCHVKGAGQTKVEEKESTAAVEWFVRDNQEDDEHWFELPSTLAGTPLALLATANGGTVLSQEITLPPLEQAEPFPARQGGAAIYDLRVVEVKKGVFLSARIAWKTDTITDAQVFYGEGNLEASTFLDDRWDTEHEITIAGLDAHRRYTFVAVSHDIFGNKAVSPQRVLATDDFYDHAPAPPSLQSRDELEVRSRFYQDQGRFFARFASSRPVSLRLGRNSHQAAVGSTGQGGQLPLAHPELTDVYALTITVCVGCHPDAKGPLSHPVDVRPKAGMHIPPEYAIMPDGRLSCMSCHQAHASDHEYRLTRARRKDLCLGCHRNFG